MAGGDSKRGVFDNYAMLGRDPEAGGSAEVAIGVGFADGDIFVADDRAADAEAGSSHPGDRNGPLGRSDEGGGPTLSRSNEATSCSRTS